MIPAVCNNYLQGGILLSGGSGINQKFSGSFPIRHCLWQECISAGTFRTGVGIQVIIITYIIRILAVIFTYF